MRGYNALNDIAKVSQAVIRQMEEEIRESLDEWLTLDDHKRYIFEITPGRNSVESTKHGFVGYRFRHRGGAFVVSVKNGMGKLGIWSEGSMDRFFPENWRTRHDFLISDPADTIALSLNGALPRGWEAHTAEAREKGFSMFGAEGGES